MSCIGLSQQSLKDTIVYVMFVAVTLTTSLNSAGRLRLWHCCQKITYQFCRVVTLKRDCKFLSISLSDIGRFSELKKIPLPLDIAENLQHYNILTSNHPRKVSVLSLYYLGQCQFHWTHGNIFQHFLTKIRLFDTCVIVTALLITGWMVTPVRCWWQHLVSLRGGMPKIQPPQNCNP